MKLVAVTLLLPGMLCISTLAMAERPVPFRSYMQAAGAQPTVPPSPDAKNQFIDVSNPPAPAHLTSEGKAMTIAGYSMLAGGGLVIAGTAAAWSSNKGALYAGGAGLCAGGVTLIIFGHHHRRSAE